MSDRGVNDKPARAPAFRVVEASFVASAGPSGTLPAPVHAEIAFAGRSNVGKSTLINGLVERKNLVRTSSTPGSTRAVNLFQARGQDGTVLSLADLPGYGFAKRSKAETQSWKRLIETYLGTRSTLGAVVVIVDVRRGAEEDDLELLDFVRASEAPSRRPVAPIVVATKLDKLPLAERKVALARVQKGLVAAGPGRGARVFGFSGVTGEGRDALWRALLGAALGRPDPLDANAPSEVR